MAGELLAGATAGRFLASLGMTALLLGMTKKGLLRGPE
jgi:hypothetical protein